jgi:SAM-dependent methyltransferase
MSASIWESPWSVTDLRECSFYHTMDLPGVGEVAGDWDLRETVDSYLGPCPLKGRSLLDLGCASGFLSFTAEQRGASVVSFDLRDATRDLTLVPYAYREQEQGALLAAGDEYVRKWKNGYWLAHRLLGSEARVHYGNVYSLPDELGQFDVVLLGQILVHLQNPLAALTAAAQRAREHLVIVERVLPGEHPIAVFLPPVVDRADQAWWHCSLGVYRRFLRILGFVVEDVGQARHLCRVYGKPQSIPLTTITARRGAVPHEPPSEAEVDAFEAAVRPHAGLARRTVRRILRALRGTDRQPQA